jgi:hypothetical protein
VLVVVSVVGTASSTCQYLAEISVRPDNNSPE